jgi:DNA-binding MarR family transcriptional regulator
VSKLTSADLEAGSIYATFWRMVYMSVHRYGSPSTGELLIVMTIALLHKAGYDPTIPELVEITGLNKSNVSRYVSRQIKEGFLTEVVDPQDRRRRRLHSTQLGKKDEKWHESQTLKMAGLTSEALRGLGKSKNPAADLRKILISINGSSAKST